MKQIILYIGSLKTGGAERQFSLLANELFTRNYDITVVCNFRSSTEFEASLIKQGVKVLFLNDKVGESKPKKLYQLIRGGFRLRSYLKQTSRPTILYSAMDLCNLLGWCAANDLEYVKVVWGIRSSNVSYSLLHQLPRWFCARVSRYVSLIIFNSWSGKEYHEALAFAGKKHIVIPNGIDTTKFRPCTVARERIRQEWGILDQEKSIGLVGRLDPMKDHPTFLKAVALAQENKSIRFVCVGDGPANYRHELHQLAQNLGITQQLIWAGARHDMPAVYNAFDIIVSSSYGEGFPNVIGEAMACGVPCIVTDVGDSAKIVGETGYVVPPKHPEVLAQTIVKILTLDLTQNKIVARKRIEQCFSLNQLIDSTEKALKSVVDS